MTAANRIIVNTLAQYTRLLFSVVISLYATRLILRALGQTDYGIYSLVAGVVVLLGFITNAMVITTQRHLSYGYGDEAQAKESNLGHDNVRRIFSNCLVLHIIIAAAVFAVMIVLERPLFAHVLVIDDDRRTVAVLVYRFMAASLLLTFITAPYKALFIARENIVYTSAVEVADSLLRLLVAFALLQLHSDRLAAYGFLMMLVTVFNYGALAVYGSVRFRECLLLPRIADLDGAQMRRIVGFAGWTIYSMGCVLGRSQGLAVILNRFFGAIINSAYGIASQIFASVQFVAQAVVNAMSPQLIKAEGGGDRQRMLTLASLTSKYSLLLLALVVVPVSFEMPGILQLWLGTVPEHTATLSVFILVTSLCDQTTIGLNVANQAIGRIRNFSLCINTIKLLTLVVVWLCLRRFCSVEAAMWCYLAIEIVCAAIRLPFLRYLAGLRIRRYLAAVLLRSLPSIASMILVGWFFTTCVSLPVRFVFTFAVTVIVGGVVIWLTALGKEEKTAAARALSVFVSNFARKE